MYKYNNAWNFGGEVKTEERHGGGGYEGDFNVMMTLSCFELSFGSGQYSHSHIKIS